MATKEQMCEFKDCSHTIEKPEDAPKWVRCIACGRRLKPRLIDCHFGTWGSPCWHWHIPPHKVKGWWKIGKTKKTSRDIGG